MKEEIEGNRSEEVKGTLFIYSSDVGGTVAAELEENFSC